MAYVAVALLGLLLALLAVVVTVSQRHRRIVPKLPGRSPRLTPTAQLRALQGSGRYRGVRIESHCRASSALAGREFPLDTAPALPVGQCSAAVCECVYVGLPERRLIVDRRSGSDRRQAIRSETSDRRSNRPRRRTDEHAWEGYGSL